jgi:hypothetical protein
MIAFHGDPAIKEKYLARVRAHAAADEIIHGKYWEGGKGCAVGCTIHSGDHKAYEVELGIPMILAKLEDNIFESLANSRSKLWPEQFLVAPRVGADLSLVWPKFAIWLLVDPDFGVIQFRNKWKNSKKAIQDVADAYQRIVDGNTDGIDWFKLQNAYYAANDADYTAYSAAAYASAAAYYAAADSAAAYASAAAYYAAADSAAAYYAAAAPRQKFRIAQANKLLELMSAA